MFALIEVIKDRHYGDTSIRLVDIFDDIVDARKAMREEYESAVEELRMDEVSFGKQIGDWKMMVYTWEEHTHFVILDRTFSRYYEFN